MKHLFKIFLLGLVALSCQDSNYQQFDPTAYVRPNLGSVHGRWFFYTPASVPFGMAKLAPQTNAYEGVGSWAPQGYDDRHTSIEGFGHFHEFQIGGVVVMPTTGEIQTIPGTLDNPELGYRSRFDKETENATTGYYTVYLKDHQVRAELTATKRVGFHRYTYPKSDQANLILDIGHKQGESSDVTDAFARMIGQNAIEGYVVTNPEYVKFCDPGNRVKMYFFMKMNREPTSFGAFTDSLQIEGVGETMGTRNGLFLTFDTREDSVLELQVGLSYTSIENARLNLELESKGVTFDDVRNTAQNAWKEQLGRIQVSGSSEENRIKFYTGLYHALLGRGLASDVKGTYVKYDKSIGQIPLNAQGDPAYHHYNTDGIWGGFWNLSQLWALAYPEYFSQYVQSNIDFYKDTGWLHDGMAAGAFTNGVQTNFQGLLIASAYHAGVRDFDVETGYQAALKNEVNGSGRNLGNGKYDLHWFLKKGYVPYQDTTISNGWLFNFGASHTLEYAFSSYAVAQMAKDLGSSEEYEQLTAQAGYWQNLFDSTTGYIRPKLPDSSFLEDFDPMKPWDGFQEGNAYQYTWYVPHDVAGLMSRIGPDRFNERLENMFINAQKSIFGGGKEIDSFSGLEKLYNHGNQPCLHNSWLFNYSGKPWLTQKWVRTILDEFYGIEPLHGYGYGQDEDQGQLGAWYVMASLGLFDVVGHSNQDPTFQFSGPVFDEISIQLNPDYYPGDQLVIRTERANDQDRYIQDVRWNEEQISSSWMRRDRLMQGGELVFRLGSEPNKDWGVDMPPPSMSDED